MLHFTKKLRNLSVVSIAILLMCSPGAYAQKEDTVTLSGVASSYTKVTSVRKEGVKDIGEVDNLNASERTIVKSFADGFGRTVQTSALEVTPEGLDIVQPSQYLNNGMPVRGYLPYAHGSGEFFRKRATYNNSYEESEQYLFYQQQDADYATDTAPYAEARYENSPLGRTIAAGNVGSDWQPETGHATTYAYRVATAADAIRFFDPAQPALSSREYTAAELQKISVVEVTDEDGNRARSFSGLSGQTIMTEQEYEEGQFYRTYYSYDLAGRLRYTVPPKAVEILDASGTWDLTGSNVSKLLFTYTYDQEHRLTEAKFPDKEAVYYLYDPLGRTALVQDGRLRQENKWTFIKYDRRQRPVYSGIWQDTRTRAQLQQAIDDYYDQGGTHYETESSTGLHGYTNNVFPQVAEADILTVSYYDHYDTDRDGQGRLAADHYQAGIVEGQEAAAYERVRGMAVASKERILGTSDWLENRMFFDKWGRLIQAQSNNHLELDMKDISTVAYDYEGKPLRQQSTVYGVADTVTTRDRFTYDHAGRVLQVYHQVKDQEEVLVANYRYNTLGELIGKDLHGYQDNSRFFQAVDIRRNIRGWLTAFNEVELDAVQSNALKDIFGFELHYQKDEAGLGSTPKYNGSVTAITWKANNELQDGQPVRKRSYAFDYDKMNRLKAADYAAWDGSSWSAEASAYDVSNLSYDANGNILSLKRNAQPDENTAASAIDHLSYTYESGSNRLKAVSDAATTAGGFLDGATLGTEYTYDGDGNLERDENKSIDITYNILSKTATVTSDSATVTYTYSASGRRLREHVAINNDSATIRDMVGSMVWEHKEGLTPALRYLSMPEGRVVKEDASFRYEYFYTDHQGNTRVSWTPVEASQTQHTLTMEAAADEEGDYPKFSNVASHRDNTYAYQGSSSAKVTNSTGPYISIPVAKGDTIDASVFYYHSSQVSSSSMEQTLTMQSAPKRNLNDFAFMAPLITTTPRIAGNGDIKGFGKNVSLNLLALYPLGKALFSKKPEQQQLQDFSSSTMINSTAPAAYLEIIEYDSDSTEIGRTSVQVGDNVTWTELTGQMTASANGYIVVQLYSQDTQDVWFDNLQIDHRRPDRAVVVQENHYYPFGLQMSGVVVNTALPAAPNRKLYNAGADWQKETGFYSTQYREYDPALGRFHAIDPMAGSFATWTPYMYSYNDPVNANDPSGAVANPGFNNETWNIVENLWNNTEASKDGSNNVATWNSATGYSYFNYDPAKGTLSEREGPESSYRSGGRSRRWTVKRRLLSKDLVGYGTFKLESLVYPGNNKEIRGFGFSNDNTIMDGYNTDLLKKQTIPLPDPGLYLNGETVTVQSVDYMLYDNQWLKLYPKAAYNDYLDKFYGRGRYKQRHPKWKGSPGPPRRRGVPWTREMITSYAHMKKVVFKGGLLELGFGGSVAWGTAEYVITNQTFNQFKKTILGRLSPIAAPFFFTKGQWSAYFDLMERMEIHDKAVLAHRNNK